MSEGEYQYQMALCESAGFENVETPPTVPEGYWRVRGGALLEISKMTVEHLKNAISLFVRAGRGDEAKISELVAELARR